MTAPEYCHYDAKHFGSQREPAEWIVRLVVRKPGPLADAVREVGVCAKHLKEAGRMGTVLDIRRAPEPPVL